MSIFGGGRESVFRSWREKREERAKAQPSTSFTSSMTLRSYEYSGVQYPISISRPSGTDAVLPVLFDIHGGGFTKGVIQADWDLDLYLAQQGICVVAIEYPAADQGDYAGMIEAVAEGIRSVLKDAETLRIDPDRAFILGCSAGASIALALSCLSLNQDLAYRLLQKSFSDLRFRGIVLNHPVVFLKDFLRLPTRKNRILRKCLRGDSKSERAFETFSDPSKILLSEKDKLPWIRLIISQADQKYFSSGQELLNFLNNSGFKVESEVVFDPGLGHLFNVKDVNSLKSCLVNNATASFVSIRSSKEG